MVMKFLSRWASRHVPLAITLLILVEVANGINGLLMGATLLGGWSASALWLVTGLVLIGIGSVRVRYAKQSGFWPKRWCLLGAFVGNVLLFGCVGGLLENSVQSAQPASGVWGNRRVNVVGDTLRPASDSIQTTDNQPMVVRKTRAHPRNERRLLYVFLAILGVGLAYFAVGLSCSLSCSGYGFAAALVFLFGFLGSVLGSAYFLKRAIAKQLKRSADMRRRDLQRFGLAWLILIGIFLTLILL